MPDIHQTKWLLKKPHVITKISQRLGHLIPDQEYQLIVGDRQYRTVSIEWVSNLIVSDDILTGAYKQDIFDCEDIALYLRTKASLFALHNEKDAPLAMGLILTDEHAFNFCIDNTRALVIIDTTNYKSKGYCRNKDQFEDFLDIDKVGNKIRLVFI
jgi:hypothetical protein